MNINIPNYKISEFDQTTGIITLNFQNEIPFMRPAPIIDSVYLSGDELDTWIKALYLVRKTITYNIDHTTIANADAVTAMVDSTPFA